MAVLEIMTYPHPCLREKAEPVTVVDDLIRRLLDDMAETMYEAPGIGLAAPQVGVSKRAIVIDIHHGDDEYHDTATLLKLVNPTIIERKGFLKSKEGCLSLPDLEVQVERSEEITVSALDYDGSAITFSCQGLLAIAIQHEIDHLEAILLIDRASPLKRRLYRNQLRKKGLIQIEASL